MKLFGSLFLFSVGWQQLAAWRLCCPPRCPPPHVLSSCSQRQMPTSLPERVNILHTLLAKLRRGKKPYLLGFIQHLVWPHWLKFFGKLHLYLFSHWGNRSFITPSFYGPADYHRMALSSIQMRI